MNHSAVEILSNPKPGAHIVYPYTDEPHVVSAVSLFSAAGLRKGEAVLLVMAQSHCSPVRKRLIEDGFDVPGLEASGQLACKDAADLLGTFMFDGIIDEHKFQSKISALIDTAKTHSKSRTVRVFGEMVSLIWSTNYKATHRLEELWNDVIAAHKVPLLCAYSLSGTQQLPSQLVECHSHAVA